MNLTIRPATEIDLPAMIEIERNSPSAAHWTSEQYQRLLELGVVLVAHAQDVLVGFICAGMIAPEWEIENVVVADQHRRQGIADALLKGLLEQATSRRGEVVRLEVRESNRPARGLYEKHGFSEKGRRRHYYQNPEEDAVVYELRLGCKQ